MDVKVDWVVTDSGSVMENADLAMTDGVFVVEDADLGASVVDFNVDRAVIDEVFAVDDSISLVPLTTDEKEAFG